MSTVEVYRGDGLVHGTDISVPMLADGLLVLRGRQAMDGNAHELVAVTLETVPIPGIRLGQLVQVHDPLQTKPYLAKVVGISLSGTLADPRMKLNLERPA